MSFVLFGVIGRIARKTLHSKCRVSLSLGLCSETWRHTTFLITSATFYLHVNLSLAKCLHGCWGQFQVLRLFNFLTIICSITTHWKSVSWKACVALKVSQVNRLGSKPEQKHTCCQGEEYQPRTTGPLLPAITRGTSGQGPRLQPCWRSTRGVAMFLHLRMGNSTYLNGRGEVKAVWKTVNYCCVSNRVMLYLYALS